MECAIDSSFDFSFGGNDFDSTINYRYIKEYGTIFLERKGHYEGTGGNVRSKGKK